jgi:hypothetical protein
MIEYELEEANRNQKNKTRENPNVTEEKKLEHGNR